MKKIFTVAAIFFSSHTFAQQDTATLHEVIVTANRHPQKQSNTGKVVTVITREELARNSGSTLPEILNRQSGITIIGANNNLGTNQDIFLQGASSGKTLILIDGVPAYDPSTISTAFDINHFNPENIERIEIVRGAMSTLYGSDAIAGVINIITRKAALKPVHIQGTLAAGSFHTFKGVAGLSGSKGPSRYTLQYHRLQSQGFSSAYDTTGQAGFDNDGFIQNTVSGNFATDLSSRIHLKLNGQAGRYRTDLDAGAFRDERDFTATSANLQGGAGIAYRYNKGILHLNYNVNRSQRDYLDDSIHVNGFATFTEERYTGRFRVAEVYTNFQVSDHVDLLIGSDYRWQNTDQRFFSVSSWGPYKSERGSDSTRMTQRSVFASILLKQLGGFHIEVGGRYNNHSDYGNNLTYSFNPSLLLSDRIKLFSNIGSAFKAPSLYQLFVVNNGTSPLQPELSRTMDAGVEYIKSGEGFHARALVFSRRIEQGIDYSFVTYTYFNHHLQKDRGGELEAGYTKGKVSARANYTYITGEVNTLNYRYNPATWNYEVTGDTTYNNLFRRAKHTINLSTGVQVSDRLFVSIHGRIAGKRFEPVFMGSPIALDPYYTVDLYTEYRFTEKVKAFADLKNMTNSRYFDVSGFSTRPLSLMAGLHLQL